MTREVHLAPPRRRLGVLILSLAVFMLAGSGAWAFWSAIGTGSGAAVAGTLAAPGGVQVGSAAGIDTVSVSWTASAGPLAPQGYYVTRTAVNNGDVSAACGTSSSAITPAAAVSCTDTPVPDGQYTYSVTAVYNSWTARSAASDPVTVLAAIQTSTHLDSSPNPSVVGQAVTYTATVSASTGTPNGSVTFKDGSQTIECAGGDQELSAGVATCSVTYGATGDHTITAVYAGEGSFLGSTSDPVDQAVGKASQTIVFNSTAPSGAKVGGATYAVTATGGGSSNPVTFTSDTSPICKVSGSTVSFVGAGLCTINANQAGDDNYFAAEQVQQSFTVGKGSQTINFTSTAPSSAKVGGATYAVTATGGGSGNPVTFTSDTPSICTVSGSTVSFVGAGSCTINANQAGDDNYDAAPQVQQSFNVGKGSQAISFTSTAPTTAAVGGSTYSVSATGGASGNPVTFTSDTPTICTVSGSTVSFVGAGSCTINANQAGDSNYDAAPQAQQSFTVARGSQSITLTSTAPTTATVGGSSYTVTATGGASGNPVTFTSDTPTICTVSGSTVSFVGAGSCTINANQAGNSNYDAAPQVQQNFSVSPAPAKPTNLVVTVNGANKITPTWDVVPGMAYECQSTSAAALPISGGWTACASGVQWNGQNGPHTFYVRATRGGAVSAYESKQFSG